MKRQFYFFSGLYAFYVFSLALHHWLEAPVQCRIEVMIVGVLDVFPNLKYSVSDHMDLLVGLFEHLHGITAGFLHSKWTKRLHGRSHKVFYDVTSEVTLRHFCNLLLVRQVSPTWCRMRQHKRESLGGILETGYSEPLIPMSILNSL